MPGLNRLALFAALALLPACATPSEPNSLENRMLGTFAWTCGDGVPVTVRFAGDPPTAEVRFKSEVHVLDRKPTRSGWIYQQGGTQIMGTDQQMQITSPTLGTLDCRAS